MLFNSFNFLFLFLPLTVLIFLLNYKIFNNKKIAILILLIASIIFYGNHSLNHLYLFLFSIITNFIIGEKLSIQEDNHNENKGKKILIFGIIFNLSLLFLYKYFNFFSSNLSILGLQMPKSELILPIGISFYTFQQIGYLIDAQNNKTTKTNIWEYASFVSFFPQLIAGPIVHHTHFINQIKNKSFKIFNESYISNGIIIFIIGLFKKVIIADTLSREIVIPFYSNIEDGYIASSLSSWISTIFYSLQIYFDFSAYSEMAIGLGLFFGIALPINFNSPFKAESLIDYWGRWNITLSNFISSYVYLPIFKNLSYKSSNLFNNHIVAIILSMTISGFWHGANWNFIIWGFVHGVALSINHLIKANKIYVNLPKLLSRSILLVFINISFIIFRTTDVQNIKLTLISLIPFKSLFNLNTININTFNTDLLHILLLLILTFIVLYLPSTLSLLGYTSSQSNKIQMISFFKKYNFNNFQIFCISSFITLLFIISVSQLHEGKEFIYFQF